MNQQLDLFENDSFDFIQSQKKAIDEDEYQCVVLKSAVVQDEYTDYIRDNFDLQVTDVSKVCIPNHLDLESIKE